MKIFHRVQEIWSWQESVIQYWQTDDLELWPWPWVCVLLIYSAHSLTETNIWPKFNENLSKVEGDMQRTSKCYRWTDWLTDEGHSNKSLYPICLLNATRKSLQTNMHNSVPKYKHHGGKADCSKVFESTAKCTKSTHPHQKTTNWISACSKWFTSINIKIVDIQMVPISLL